MQSDGFEGEPDVKLSVLLVTSPDNRAAALVDVTFPTAENLINLKIVMKADRLGAVAKAKELEKYKQREHAHVAQRNGFQFYAAAMEK